MPGRRRREGDEDVIAVEGSSGASSAQQHSLNSAALDVVLENLTTNDAIIPKALLSAKDLARLSAADTRCRDAVRAAVDKRRQRIPTWVANPWPELFCTHTFARLTPTCKIETTMSKSVKTVSPTTLLEAGIYGRERVLRNPPKRNARSSAYSHNLLDV